MSSLVGLSNDGGGSSSEINVERASWLDVTMVTFAPPSDEQIANATPRTKTGKSSAIIHPNDLLQALTWITPRSLEDISQKHRPDLSLIVESHNTLSIKLPEQLTDNIHLIQDPEVVKLLQ